MGGARTHYATWLNGQIGARLPKCSSAILTYLSFVPGGLNNPLGARALYLGKTLYRIHGTNEPSTIGRYETSGCIRLRNEDVIDLYRRVKIGAEVVVLAAN